LQNEKTVIGWTRLDKYTLSAKRDFLLNASIQALKTKKPINTDFPTPKSKGGSVKIPVVSDGNYDLTLMKTLSGQTISTARVTSQKGFLTVKLPAFTGDISFKVEKVGA
jgi:hypothetical protein